MSAILPKKEPRRTPLKLPSLTPPSLSPAASSSNTPPALPQLSVAPPARPSLKVASVTSGMAGLSLAIPARDVPSHYRTALDRGDESDEETEPKWGVGDQERMAGELKNAIHGEIVGLEDDLSGATRRARSASRVGARRPSFTVPREEVDTPTTARPGDDDPVRSDAGPWEFDVTPETLKDLGRLGEGASGEVRKVLHLPTGLVMAKKTIQTSPNPKIHKQHLRELLFMRECEDPHVVQYYGGFLHDSDTQIAICMEYCEAGSLDSLYKKHKANGWRTGEKTLSKVAEGMLSGLSYLHSRRIVHRDIKPSNVLVTMDGQVKLCDFGVSGELVNSLAGTFLGTTFYLSPERIRGENYSITSDVWSFILTILEITVQQFPYPLPGEAPLSNLFELSVYWASMDNPSKVLETDDRIKYTRNFKEFVKACLEKDPKLRPTPELLLSSAWIQKSVTRTDQADLARWLLNNQTIPKERVLHLEGITAPRLGNKDREDEPFAYESREFLRALLVGKEVGFSITNTISTTTPPLEFGIVTLNSKDIALEVVSNGWARVREGGPKGEEEEGSRKQLLKEAEEAAKAAGKGIWAASPSERRVEWGMPEDPAAFLAQWKGKPIDAIIEGVPNGGTVRARLLLSPAEHQIVSVGLAGVRAPRASSIGGSGESKGEEYGDEARFFVESRLLQRAIKITLLALPVTSTPTSFSASAESAAPPPAPTYFLGTVAHPAGNIAALLLATGTAKVLDWHAGFLSQSPTPGIMAEFRKAEAEAKAGRRGLWASLPLPAPGAAAVQAQQEKERKWDGVVTRVWGADMLSILKNGEQTERRIQLASVRQPKPTDPKLAGLQAEGKELLRKKLIGKSVHVQIDYIKPAEGDFESRECATIRVASGANVAERLVELGLVSVIRHRQGDEQRSSDYDKLMAAEAKAIAETKGIHSGKDFPLGRIIDASESAQKAAPFLSSFKRAGRTAGVVDFVAAGSRFKIFVPKQDTKLTFVLSGIRAPRTARNPSEKSEPYGQEAATFMTRKVLQRDVEFLVESADKSGGFIGKLFLGKDDVAVALVREGLARVDEYAAERGARELLEAQEEAKRAKKNIWKSYDAEAEAAASGAQAAPASARKEYVDLMVSEVRGDGVGGVPFSFAVQLLQNGGIPALEKLMSDLTLHHKSSDVTPANFVPRTNDVVSAKFSADDTWYRARIRRCNPARKEADIIYIDYGNTEIIPFSRLRPLAPQFKGLDAQAKEATLSFVHLLGSETEYGPDALDRFRDLVEGRQLVANIDAREANLLHLSLFDPADPSASTAHEASINVSLVREGLARIDKGSRFRGAYPSVVRALEEAVKEAKRSRAGAYELGDIFDD
ncbi:transcription factor (Snd1/p100) [Pseudohyphozyma bogoriensis]|nr:transcription factor (Snd1/p100) [Pseudohyphozyma bogoriensis]